MEELILALLSFSSASGGQSINSASSDCLWNLLRNASPSGVRNTQLSLSGGVKYPRMISLSCICRSLLSTSRSVLGLSSNQRKNQSYSRNKLVSQFRAIGLIVTTRL